MKNAIIMASGLGERMRPLTEKTPKPLIKVKEIPLIETIISALLTQNINNICIVTGYLKEQFDYLKTKYPNVVIIENPDYNKTNNISSVYYAKDFLKDADCYICEADLFIANKNILNCELQDSCYFGKYIKGYSSDWIFEMDKNGFISKITKGGENCYNMTGISYFKNADAKILSNIIEEAYSEKKNLQLFWDEVVNMNLDKLNLKIHPISENQIFEIDTVEELNTINERLNFENY